MQTIQVGKTSGMESTCDGARGVIYALIDPRDKAVRYIGQTINPQSRFITHLNDKQLSAKCLWIDGLLRVGLEPQMVVLGTYPIDDLDVEEAALIGGLRATGAFLYNIADGGTSCSRPHPRKRVFRQVRAPRTRKPKPPRVWTEEDELSRRRLLALITPPYEKYRPNRDDPNRGPARIERWFERRGTTFLDWQVDTGRMSKEDGEAWREIHRKMLEGVA